MALLPCLNVERYTCTVHKAEAKGLSQITTKERGPEEVYRIHVRYVNRKQLVCRTVERDMMLKETQIIEESQYKYS